MSTNIEIENMLTIDSVAWDICNRYIEWENRRQSKVKEWTEIQEYIFATDTTKTTNSKLPWANKTTLPKLCQIRDNLFANYMATMFPKRKWLLWQGDNPSDEDMAKKTAIESYVGWCVERNEFYDEVAKLVLDYIDYGNVFATVEWVDKTQDLLEGDEFTNTEGQTRKVGYVGPMLKRISPLDIVFNPLASNFASSPKIIRSSISLGQLKNFIDKEKGDNKKDAQALLKYLQGIRRSVSDQPRGSNLSTKDRIFNISGFDSFRNYLEHDTIEILTFYGDYYDKVNNKYYENRIVKVVDRHKVISDRPNPSYFGTMPIYHAGWRIRPDNLWAMGPLDNLLGMQYRIDHLENMKSDVFDLIAAPPLKIKGYVNDFTWAPFERIHVDEQGDVELMSPDVQVLQADNQIAIMMQMMEEMAGSPKEAVGFRTPGEKTKYEVQRLENAASRVFENKIKQFERGILENLLNAMLELSRRNVDPTTIRVFNDEFKIATFMTLSAEDITGQGRIKPIAARHFAEQAQQVQDLTNFFGSAPGQDPGVLQHFSTIGLAKLWEGILNIEDYNIVQPNIRMTEQAEMQQLSQIHEQESLMQTQTPGLEGIQL